MKVELLEIMLKSGSSPVLFGKNNESIRVGCGMNRSMREGV
jgi:hypothetical protein